MLATFIGLHAVGWDEMTSTWWGKSVAALACFGTICGALYLLYQVYRTVEGKVQRCRSSRSDITATIAALLDSLTGDRIQPRRTSEPLKSFGVYLGAFADPPSPAQANLLTQWASIIVNPLEDGVAKALETFQGQAPKAIARLDVASIVKLPGSQSRDDIVRAVVSIVDTVSTRCKTSLYVGVLVAGWKAYLPSSVLNKLVSHLALMGYVVHLEVGPPYYFDREECQLVNMNLVKGIVFRNGIISADGDRRNYFQMEDMRRGLRAFAKVSYKGDTTVMMWETVDDGVELSYAVTKRTFSWCRFNCAISWIGPAAALTDADVAARTTVRGDPLGAMMWLKNNETMAAHDAWRRNECIREVRRDDTACYASLEPYLPGISLRLALVKHQSSELAPLWDHEVASPPSLVLTFGTEFDPLSFSTTGLDFTGLGCFQLGLEVTRASFIELVQDQHRLRDLDLLQRLQPEEMAQMGEKLAILLEPSSSKLAEDLVDSITELCSLLTHRTLEGQVGLVIFVGLQSGLNPKDGGEFFGLYDRIPHSDNVEMYISSKANDRVGVVMHTFLSSRGHNRADCFAVEHEWNRLSDTLSERWGLPPRLVCDLERLTPMENILFLRRTGSRIDFNGDPLSGLMQSVCRHYLLEDPTSRQRRALTSSSYLRGNISGRDLIASRLAWYEEHSCSRPSLSEALDFFEDVNSRLPGLLKTQQSEFLVALEMVFGRLLVPGQIDASADILALSVFCAFRRLALEEVYLEILDRNPLPNPQPDQAACFSEMFALGSQCEAYFDMTSNVLGSILSERYKQYYTKHQPPRRDDGSTECPTAYASSQVDLLPQVSAPKVSAYYKITFLGIFAVPALIDIILLTTIGRGLYLTTYMSTDEKSMATAALMTSLLLTGAISTWIGHGGTYYLHAMAFPALNMFVLTRFIAGVAITLAVGAIALVAIGLVKGFYAGAIYSVYLFGLSTYLNLLGTLSIYQYPGFAFQSGRTVVIACLPLLLLSPILTLWIGHDIVVYLSVLYGFVGCLAWGTRRTMTQWGSWYLEVPVPVDAEVITWFNRSASNDNLDLPADVDLAATPFPRTTLLEAVERELCRRFWQKATTDSYVKELADGYEATIFLMDWYSRYTRTAKPYPFSPTWNLQCKAAIDSLKDMQKGLKLHGAFSHWRQGSAEIWCGFLYFIIALMDKWVFLISGGQLVGLSDSDSTVFRLSVGFGLAYYLMAAICLDGVAQPLWVSAQRKTDQPITSLAFLHQAADNDARARRRLYWRNFAKFFVLHTWSLCVTSTIMWTFEGSRDATVMFLAYIGAYSGLLVYQYNRIFTGVRALMNLSIAACVGLVGGPILVRLLPEFQYGGVCTLGLATWTTALTSFWTADIGRPRRPAASRVSEKPLLAVYTCNGFHTDVPCPSSYRLREAFISIQNTSSGATCKISAHTRLGAGISTTLERYSEKARASVVKLAFPEFEVLRNKTVDLWSTGHIDVTLVLAAHFAHLVDERADRFICQDTGDQLHVMIPFDLDSNTPATAGEIAQVVIEVIIEVVARTRFGYSCRESELAGSTIDTAEFSLSPTLSLGLKTRLRYHDHTRQRIANGRPDTLVRDLLFGVECDIEWDTLHHAVRIFLLDRCLGKISRIDVSVVNWIESRFPTKNGSVRQLESRLALSDLAAHETVLMAHCARSLIVTRTSGAFTSDQTIDRRNFQLAESRMANQYTSPKTLDKIRRRLANFAAGIQCAIKFSVIALVADSGFQRELDFVLARKSFALRWPAKVMLCSIWLYCKTLQNLILPVVLHHRRESLGVLKTRLKGDRVVVNKSNISFDGIDGTSTGFFRGLPNHQVELTQYSGKHKVRPETSVTPISINTYTRELVLIRREEYSGKTLRNAFQYERNPALPSSAKIPLTRKCLEGSQLGSVIEYDLGGRVVSGSYQKGDRVIGFQLFHRQGTQSEDELLRGRFVIDRVLIDVDWSVSGPGSSARPDSRIPYSKVTAMTIALERDVYHSVWNYDHRSHPVISTRLNGSYIDTPAMISKDEYGVAIKPSYDSFVRDDPLVEFPNLHTGLLARLLRRNSRCNAISTARARTHLWTAWKRGNDLDAVSAQWLDEHALRSDKMLTSYWRARDTSRLGAASRYLDLNADAIMAKTDVDPDISSWSPLVYKVSDLYVCGQGGDTRINTRSVSTQMQDGTDSLHVLAMDTGTWPNEGGGVSACRRDVVNDLKTIRWHVIAEAANDFGFPKFQIERNVQSLTVLPLWGLDFLSPTHGIFTDQLDSAIQIRSHNTKDDDISENFLPILTSLVRCSRAVKFDREHVEEATRALVDLNAYFEVDRHWGEVWMSDIVKNKWRELWLTEDMDNAIPISKWLDAERPSLLHLDNALDMWHRYLFIFSIPVPDKIPDVFQASHHFAGASYGVLCKLKRKCSLHVWDHCISWREVTVFLSSAMSFDSPMVCTSLISLSRMTSVLILYHADVVLPCADFFNPGWEIELGTQEGTIGHRKSYAKRIDPVVNGICNMESFKPVKEVKSKKPTVVMLSHVRFVKDIKNALLAADIIVNEWGFEDYQLDIYGDMEKAPAYSVECKEILASKSLRKYVTLKGLGSPSKVLEEAWIFLNSSISEGLPLAMGEAALAGVPVVCTDVGASFRVVTDPITWKKFSAVVAPNDPYSLARAQINVLGLLDEWSEYAQDPPGYRPKLSLQPTRDEVHMATKRMYEKAEHRRKLGMMGRRNVLGSFSGDRYLREHEQMLWIAKLQSDSYRARAKPIAPIEPSYTTWHRGKVEVSTSCLPVVGYFASVSSWGLDSSPSNDSLVDKESEASLRSRAVQYLT